MKFKEWLMTEAVVNTADLEEAIIKTLEFKIPGKWSWDSDPNFSMSYKSIRVHGLLKNNKTPRSSQYFYVAIYALINKPIGTYDSIEGDTNMEIKSTCFYVYEPGKVENLGEKTLRTPYDLANWIEIIINSFGNDDDGDEDQPEYNPRPTLVGAGA